MRKGEKRFRRVICIMGRVLDQEDGLGVYSYNLLRELFPLDQRSHYVVLLKTAKNAHLFADMPNVTVKVVPCRTKTVWDQVHVPLEARRYGADLIFNPKFSLPVFWPRKGVFVLHGSDWYVNPQNYKWWDNLYIRLMLPFYCRKATKLLAISECILNDLVEYAAVPRHKVMVSYAAPSAHFEPAGDREGHRAFISRYRLPERFILTVARAYHTGNSRLPEYPGGNIERLLRAYWRYKEEGGRLPLVVVGYEIEAYLRSRGFSDTDLQEVHFTGYIPHDAMHHAYQGAELFVLTTLYESFAFPLVEAMASGCPAIVPKTGACPEIAAGAARLVDPLSVHGIKEAIAELAGSADARQALRQAGLERVKSFTWRRTAEWTLQAIDAAVPLRIMPAPTTLRPSAVGSPRSFEDLRQAGNQ